MSEPSTPATNTEAPNLSSAAPKREFVVTGSSGALIRKRTRDTIPFFSKTPPGADNVAASPAASQAEAQKGEAANASAPGASRAHEYDLAGISISDDNREAVDGWGGVFAREGVTQDHARAIISHALDGIHKETGEPKKEHFYLVDRFDGFSQSDQVPLTRWLNFFHKLNLPEQQVRRLISTYKDAAVQARRQEVEAVRLDRELQHRDRGDIDNARRTLRAEWGDQYGANLKAIRAYVKALPAAERDKILADMDDSGGLTVNTPAKLRDLLKRVHGVT